jgi:glycine betaine transporter
LTLELYRHQNRLSPLFWVTVALLNLLVLVSVVSQGQLATTLEYLTTYIAHTFGWVYTGLFNATLVALFAVVFSPWGRLRLASTPMQRPQHSTITWLALLMCAGMGSGLLFWGAAEPLTHLLSPPTAVQSGQDATLAQAFGWTFLHWGLHPWAVYCLVTLAVGCSVFNRGQSVWPSTWVTSGLPPPWRSKLGFVLNVATVLACLMGVAATYTTCIYQLEAGIGYANWWASLNPLMLRLALLGLLGVGFMAAALEGVTKGLAKVSEWSMLLSTLLLVVVWWVYPQQQGLGWVLEHVGDWVRSFPAMSALNVPFTQAAWPEQWTLKYWGWWVAWAPFVGMFMALMSQGRTLRQVILGSILVPSLWCWGWFWVFGQAAITLQTTTNSLAPYLNWERMAVLMFVFYEGAGALTPWLQGLAWVLMATFLINSADSATYTLAVLEEGTPQALNAPRAKGKWVWGCLLMVLTLVCLGLQQLALVQALSLVFALPLALLLVGVLLCWLVWLVQQPRC